MHQANETSSRDLLLDWNSDMLQTGFVTPLHQALLKQHTWSFTFSTGSSPFITPAPLLLYVQCSGFLFKSFGRGHWQCKRSCT